MEQYLDCNLFIVRKKRFLKEPLTTHSLILYINLNITILKEFFLIQLTLPAVSLSI